MIQVDLYKCTGCRRCEAACAFFHTGRINPSLARIKVTLLYESGLDGPVVCQQCQERYCLKCPEEALTTDKAFLDGYLRDRSTDVNEQPYSNYFI